VIVSRPFLVACAFAAAMVALATMYGMGQGAVGAASVPPMTAIAPSAARAPVPPPVAVAAAPATPAPASAPSPYESLAQKVDRLSRSPNPVDAFAAYQLVTACIWARDHEGWMARHILPGDRGLLPTARQACGDIASDQVQSRLQWLERAALAGVHHAAVEMLKEGPDGLGVSASSDIDAPENASWKQRVEAALDAGVHTCDYDSLESRVNGYESGEGVEQDRAKALTYWVAYMHCRQRLGGAPGSVLSDGDGVTRRMGTALNADQIARAVSDGRRIAQDAQPLPGDR
jgi:TPR repeat protein